MDMQRALTSIAFSAIAVAPLTAIGAEKPEGLCSYAPSRFLPTAIASGTGSVVAGSGIAVQESGIKAVPHSSGSMILTGSNGYIPRTLGFTAEIVAASPYIIPIGVAIAAPGVVYELACAPENYPEEVAKIKAFAIDLLWPWQRLSTPR